MDAGINTSTYHSDNWRQSPEPFLPCLFTFRTLSWARTRSQTHGSVRTEANSISHLWCCSIPTVPCGRRLHKRAVFLSYMITPLSPLPSTWASPNQRQSSESFLFSKANQMNTQGTTCPFVKRVSVWVHPCTVCTRAIDTARFSMNSNCGDLFNSDARLDTKVVNRLAELGENAANQHWSKRRHYRAAQLWQKW